MDINFKLLNKILDDFANLNSKRQLDIDFLRPFLPIKNRLLYQKFFDTSFLQQKKNMLSEFNHIISGFHVVNEKEKKLSKSFSINFNVLDFFSIGETLHSKLLGFFLNPNETHGQRDLFLKKMLEKLGYNYYEGSDWYITVEKRRIDILIWRESPYSAVIIENKSNNAVDQENQIYRYWFDTVYSKCKVLDNYKTNHQNFKIIYLVAKDGKLPSMQSLTKPQTWSSDLPASLPKELYPDIWFFNREIKEILFESLQEVDHSNHRLREYINQYIEYWN